MIEIEIDIPRIVEDTIRPAEVKESSSQQQHRQSPYRWVIMTLMGLALILNGLTNNAITPLQHKMTIIYDVSQIRVTLSVTLSFLVFLVVNFPVNKIIDSQGLRSSVIYGATFYFAGTLSYALINKSFNFLLLGTFFIGIGQPLLLNSLVKVPAYWFFPKNRACVTSILVGCNIVGMIIGFLIPALVIQQDNQGEGARILIGHIYLGYFILSGTILILCLLLMQSKPEIPPSESGLQRTYSLRQSYYQIKKDKNLWMFFAGCLLGYGSLICFAINFNFIIKVYGYTDLEIAINGVLMIVTGTVGASLFTIYTKKALKHKIILGVVCLGSAFMMAILCLWLNSANFKAITTFLLIIFGFVATPIVSICYDLGCELTFPMGRVILAGILNCSSLLCAFLLSIFVASVFGFKSESSSILIMGFLTIFIIFSAIFFMFVKINLKRRHYKSQQNQSTNSPNQVEMSKDPEIDNSIENQPSRSMETSKRGIEYGDLVEEADGPGIKERIML